MKVADVMTREPLYCHPETNLGAATEMLWKGNCGILPVVGDQNRVVGAVTDRDICIALGTRNRLPGEIAVGEIAPKALSVCTPNDDVRTALAAMAARKVHRLVVVDSHGALEGVLSLDDIVVKALGSKAPGALSPAELAVAMEEIVSNQVHQTPTRLAA